MNPYSSLPEKAFWKKAVASKSMFDISDLWDPKFNIVTNSKVTTFGSCFAQHIGNALKSRGFNWLITELPPGGLSSENRKKFNYEIFSARTGNIYTTSLLRQWVEWALGEKSIPDEVWEKEGRYYDPFRPVVEPGGFASIDELRKSQMETVLAFRESIKQSTFFVFTLGLTESWFNSKNGYEYPMCPGTAAGEYIEGEHVFKNQQFGDVIKNLNIAMNLMRKENPRIKFILTVSPVPLTATNSDNNVLIATMESKSILRAVAGQAARNQKSVDYFPSYEIINSPVFKGMFFEPNQRSVNPVGVNFVMDHFFSCLESKFGSQVAKKLKASKAKSSKVSDAVCEEELLNAFG
ncbi:GSCFA domain-containing protein [Halomonas sp. GT]|uniref:GSCFA domain-containing protein n=1 Tax=Halomonas sp. GT TaxID=1971364 RepID=UPI0009F306CD|nr:GSCFA domain-containing protein [Halomonas sp. GT]